MTLKEQEGGCLTCSNDADVKAGFDMLNIPGMRRDYISLIILLYTLIHTYLIDLYTRQYHYIIPIVVVCMRLDRLKYRAECVPNRLL